MVSSYTALRNHLRLAYAGMLVQTRADPKGLRVRFIKGVSLTQEDIHEYNPLKAAETVNYVDMIFTIPTEAERSVLIKPFPSTMSPFLTRCAKMLLEIKEIKKLGYINPAEFENIVIRPLNQGFAFYKSVTVIIPDNALKLLIDSTYRSVGKDMYEIFFVVRRQGRQVMIRQEQTDTILTSLVYMLYKHDEEGLKDWEALYGTLKDIIKRIDNNETIMQILG